MGLCKVLKLGDVLSIGNVTVTYYEKKGSKIKVHINAPKEIKITHKEQDAK